jgi:predicted nuclease of restriction endonuclease-like (RecB) superfamily
MNIISNEEYKQWLTEIKSKIQSAQIKASIAVNSQLITLYWEIGESIVDKQDKLGWGVSVIVNLAHDLKKEYPMLKGFSDRNLRLCKQFYQFWSEDFAKWQQLVAKIPWGHNILLISKIKDKNIVIEYIKAVLKNNWSRNILEIQIETEYYKRIGNTLNNFENTLPKPQSDLARDLMKSPYNLDFLQLTDEAQERQIEQSIINNITDFMLELGKGFAFMGRQYKIEVEDSDYYLDLLFYHIELRCFVVLELKAVPFQPEFAGKMNFYLSAVDDLFKKQFDNPSIGIILCKSGKKLDIEYTLRDLNKPIGVSNFTLMKSIPQEFEKKLPTIEEFEKEFEKYE